MQRRLQIERLRLRAQLERQQAISSVQRVRRGFTAQNVWSSFAGGRSPSASAARLLMPAVALWRRYPYVLGTAGSLLGACFRGRARFVWPLGALGFLAWRAMASSPRSRQEVETANAQKTVLPDRAVSVPSSTSASSASASSTPSS